ncbi:MAG TPA: hypothetical protein VKG45_08655 [Actinomycetes bacterium]|nr:hypothetical protein [Actinomycetes bacterium]
MPASAASSPTKAALEAAVLDLTDEQIVHALTRQDGEVKRTYGERAADTWPHEATRNLLDALGRRAAQGRVRLPG